MNNNQRLILAVVISALIIFIWQLLFPQPHSVNLHTKNIVKTEALKSNTEENNPVAIADRGEIIELGYDKKQRVKIANTYLNGSINLVGAVIDDLTLTKYKEGISSKSGDVVLLSPKYSDKVYFISFGWLDKKKEIDLPDQATVWQADKEELKVGDEVVLRWQNKQGIKFSIILGIDEHYMLNVKQIVENNGLDNIQLTSYVSLNRSVLDNKEDTFILHEGLVGSVEGKLQEVSYKNIKEDKSIEYKQNLDWLGFSDKYWLVAINPDSTFNHSDKASVFAYNYNKQQRFQINLTYPKFNLARSEIAENSTRLFVGAKELDILEKYSKQYNIQLFDRAVDFGMLYFITKPIFMLLTYFYRIIGNFGLAILLLTVVIKALLFPLAYKSLSSINKLKELQPRTAKLKELHSNDSIALQKAMMELYKKEKVNPVSGCLPIILQMPVFFALYKVLYVTIEMRHAPFFGWIKDLSTPDPTTMFNLFGLINWQPPVFLMVGVLPILMGITMFIQQSINPQPADPVQAKVMKFLPLIFTFMLSNFPSGLTLYWAWSNILSIIQQLLMMRLQKKKVLTHDIKSNLKLKKLKS